MPLSTRPIVRLHNAERRPPACSTCRHFVPDPRLSGRDAVEHGRCRLYGIHNPVTGDAELAFAVIVRAREHESCGPDGRDHSPAHTP
jgi:hypothetical protein